MNKGSRVYFRGEVRGLYGGRIIGAAIRARRGDSWTLRYPVELDAPFEQVVSIEADRLTTLPDFRTDNNE